MRCGRGVRGGGKVEGRGWRKRKEKRYGGGGERKKGEEEAEVFSRGRRGWGGKGVHENTDEEGAEERTCGGKGEGKEQRRW